MAGLFDQIQEKTKRQQSMMDRFSQPSEKTVAFNEVNVEKTKGTKAEKDKGLIVPPINYISDEVSDAQSG